MLRDELEVDSRRVAVSGLVLDPQVGNRDLVAHDSQSMPCRDFGVSMGAEPGDLAIDFLHEFVTENDSEPASALFFNPSRFFLVQAIKVRVVIGLSEFDEVAVHGLILGYEVICVEQAVPTLRKSHKFARIGFGAFESFFPREPLANKTPHVAVGRPSVAVVDMLGEVVRGNDTELAKLDDCADGGLAQAVAAIAVVEDAAALPEVNFRAPTLVRSFGRPLLLGSRKCFLSSVFILGFTTDRVSI
jgi:hypothetical protein